MHVKLIGFLLKSLLATHCPPGAEFLMKATKRKRWVWLGYDIVCGSTSNSLILPGTKNRMLSDLNRNLFYKSLTEKAELQLNATASKTTYYEKGQNTS